MSILNLIILLLLTIVDAIIDNNFIRQKKDVHTLVQYVIREMGFILLAILFSTSNTDATYRWVLSHFVYWWFFDTILNLIRKKPVQYLSDRGLDGMQPHTILWWVFKFIVFVIASLYFINPSLYSWS